MTQPITANESFFIFLDPRQKTRPVGPAASILHQTFSLVLSVFELLLLAGLVALLIQLPAKFLAIALAIGAVVWFLLPGGLPGGFHFGIGCDWLALFGGGMVKSRKYLLRTIITSY